MALRDFGRARLRPSQVLPRLATRLALPGSCKGIEMDLELQSSRRDLHDAVSLKP
jgi:hypothetical protein